MARPKRPRGRSSAQPKPSTYSGRRSHARRRRDNGDRFWIAAIVVIVLLGVGVAYFVNKWVSASKIDEATLCHAGGPVNATVMLLDMTDPLNPTQQARLRNLLDNEIAASSVDTMVALGVVSEDAGNWGVRFAKCKPETGETANVLYENPAQIARRYEEEFIEPMKATLDRLVGGDSENQSPIMEAMQSLISQTPEFSKVHGRRKLIIVSDMLQHSDTLSFYRGHGWDRFIETHADQRLADNLAGVDVEIIRIPRGGGNVPSNAIVEDFWSRYFDKQGSRPPVVSSLGDL